MNFKQFMEMALKGFKTGPFTGDQWSPRTINVADEKTVTHPKTYRQLETVLKRSTHYDFNIIVGQPDRMLGYGTNAAKKYAKELEEKGEIQIPGHITFIKTASSGEPLTAWMILHTMGHSLFDGYFEPGNKAFKDIGELLRPLYEKPGVVQYGKDVIQALAPQFQFRSAQIKAQNPEHKFGVSNVGELIFEMLAEYLWHGKVRGNNPVFRQIEGVINGALAAAVGQILVDT